MLERQDVCKWYTPPVPTMYMMNLKGTFPVSSLWQYHLGPALCKATHWWRHNSALTDSHRDGSNSIPCVIAPGHFSTSFVVPDVHMRSKTLHSEKLAAAYYSRCLKNKEQKRLFYFQGMLTECDVKLMRASNTVVRLSPLKSAPAPVLRGQKSTAS